MTHYVAKDQSAYAVIGRSGHIIGIGMSREDAVAAAVDAHIGSFRSLAPERDAVWEAMQKKGDYKLYRVPIGNLVAVELETS